MLHQRKRLSALAGFMALTASSSAFAHAKLLSSSPAKDVAAAAPTEIVLTFSEAITPAVVTLSDQDGHEVKSLGAARADGSTLHVPVTARLAAGRYIFTYRVAGADTHAVNGTLSFVVANP